MNNPEHGLNCENIVVVHLGDPERIRQAQTCSVLLSDPAGFRALFAISVPQPVGHMDSVDILDRWMTLTPDVRSRLEATKRASWKRRRGPAAEQEVTYVVVCPSRA